MARTWKTVRIFISSTFRDLHAERDHLIKVTFPRLRQWCEERRLHLVDIDLRWGVTKEQADNGRAIEICLQEIDGSRPFFICILGNRYGWVPDELPPEERYRFHGLQARTGMSITHLEIVHAIQTPVPRRDGTVGAACPHTFFYFRKPECLPDPDSLTQLTDEERQEYRSAFFELLPQRVRMLDALKREIEKRYRKEDRVFDYEGTWDPEAENPEDDKLKGRLTSLDTFGARVEADLKRAISGQFADHIASLGERDPLAEERSLHEAFIENRTQVHVPRSDIEQQITEYADSDDPRPLVLSGPPGSGKSAILAHWVRERPGEEFLLARFIGASPASTSLHHLLANLCEEMRIHFDLTEEIQEEIEVSPGQKEKRSRTQPMEVPADPIGVQNKWPRFLQAAGTQGKVVIVLDAVNQLERAADPFRAYWIPRKIPNGVRLIVSAVDYGEVSKADHKPSEDEKPDWLAALRRLEPREIPVSDLTDEHRLRIIHELPSVFCKTLDENQTRELLKNRATRNPLFLTVSLEELRIFGSFEKLPGAISGLPQLDDPHIGGRIDVALDRLFGQILDRLDCESKRLTPGLVPKLFSLLACARDGLSEQEIEGLLAQSLPDLNEHDRNGNMQIMLRQVRPYLQRKQAQQTVLVDFYHRSFWKAVIGKYFEDEEGKKTTHCEIADYFEKQDYWRESLEEQRARAKRLPPTPRPVNIRKVVELPWQRLQEQDWDKVADLLTDWQFLEAKAEAEP